MELPADTVRLDGEGPAAHDEQREAEEPVTQDEVEGAAVVGEAGELDDPGEPDESDRLADLQAIVNEVRQASASSELYVFGVEMEDIRILHGKERSYLYSTRFMSDNYANWAFLALEDDAARTLVECVREESRVYPRPMLARSLENPPFSLSAQAVQVAFEDVAASGLFTDIQSTSASNGDVYYFSTDYLSPAYARSLAEYYSVELPLVD
ncbi:MAG: hypothetical protein LBC23_00010 [Coriobacteriales bacterium]|jgi:hypothetical protein|nr:hypothetical protein [Coriobacteriales bacterium]